MRKQYRFAAVSSLALAVSSPAFAQDSAPEDGASSAEDIVVTGSRAAGRSRLDTISPVDVLSAETLQRQGTTELASALATVAPSITFPRASATDGTDSIRPATLRGLSPDQTLVLINGVRGHASAQVNVNGSVGRGSAAVDLNTIPAAAIGQIEVLRDGASAQYGSDAIAGVVNLRLREARSGGGLTVSYGEYVTKVDPALAPSRNVSDGGTWTVSGWQGFALGSEGFLTLSGEYLNRNPTSRGDYDTRSTPFKIRSRFGDPDVEQYSIYANAATPIGDRGWELYGHGGYQRRDSDGAAFPRYPGQSGNPAVDAVYPDGYLPIISVRSDDINSAIGLRGELGGWNTDINVSYGRNALTYRTLNSINATYVSGSPTDFDAGKAIYDQWIGGIDLNKELTLGGDNTVNVAFGAEYRNESYKIRPGDIDSWARGPLSGSSGAQGFPGFQPSNKVSAHRDNVSGYLDLEFRFADRFSLGVAARGEHYSDFGSTGTGKVSARYDLTDGLALRGAVSTGFRAPSLQQSYYTSTTSVIGTGSDGLPAIIETGTFPSISPVAQALGGVPLKAEKSWNYSAGFVFRSGGFNLTVDGYYIRIRDQIGLSENIQAGFSPQVAAILEPYGVSAARFFLNGIKTATKGIDVVANYRIPTESAGTFDLSLAGNFSDIDVKKVPASTAVALNPTPTLFARQRVLSIEEGTPRTKIVGAVDWKLGGFSSTLRGTYYGDVTQPFATPAADWHTGKKTLVDLEGRYQFNKNFQIALGADNLFDVYPDRVPLTATGGTQNGGVTAFPFYSPFGFNGRRLYARIGINW